MENTKQLVFPIDVTHPAEIYLNPNTGELVIECVPYAFADQRKWRLVFEPKVLQQILATLPTLEAEYGELIAEKAKLSSVQ